MTALLAGLLTGLSLIVAIGAQNAFVLRCGLARHHVGVVVAICAISDLLLIGVGTSGVGAVLTSQPTLLAVLTWLGAGYLLWCGIGSFRSARRPSGLTPADETGPTLRAVAGTALALTYLNPHVYLDTVLMLGTIANSHGSGRWLFAAGAMAGSVLWFSALGFGAHKAGRYLRRPGLWQVLDVIIGCVMIGIAVALVASHLGS